MHYPGHFNFCTNLFSMFTMKWESQNIFGMCIFIIYVTVFTLLFKICTLLILLQLNICNWWGVGCFYHPTFQNMHRPTALHFMKEDLIFHLKKKERPVRLYVYHSKQLQSCHRDVVWAVFVSPCTKEFYIFQLFLSLQ